MDCEEIVRGTFENSNTVDLKKNETDIALKMVTQYGISKIGLVFFEGANLSNDRAYQEVNDILNECLTKAKEIISSNRAQVESLAKVLLVEKEMTGARFLEIVNQI